MSCRICETRKPRRYCPGVGGDICSQCCGTEREVTIACPLDCEFLIESRRHEKFQEMDPEHVPYSDIPITEAFMNENDTLLRYLSRELAGASLDTPGAVDNDVREAIDAMIRTYRTRQSGLIYETRPANPVAGAVQQKVLQAIRQAQEETARETGIHRLRDTDVMGVLAFLGRVAVHWDNKRPRGRTFISFLVDRYGEDLPAPAPAQSSLLLP